MTTTPTTTAAERVEVTLHQLGYLIGRHHLPEPDELRVRTSQRHRPLPLDGIIADVRLADLHDLKRWAEATDAAVVTGPHYNEALHLARTVIGDVSVTLTCFGEALTP